MDEKRKYFRLTNKGEIQASAQGLNLEVIDISASSVAIVSNSELAAKGILRIQINNFSLILIMKPCVL